MGKRTRRSADDEEDEEKPEEEEQTNEDEAEKSENAEEEAKDEEENKEEEDADQEPKLELRVEILKADEDGPEKKAADARKAAAAKLKKDRAAEKERLTNISVKENEITDPKILEDLNFIKATKAESRLEIALSEALERKDSHIGRLTQEVNKLKAFISKRKQTYKRKRKDEGAPTRALSAYNIFIQDRFAQLAKENEAALKSADSDAQLRRVPPANLVAKTGNEWKDLPLEEKAKYEEKAKKDRKRYEEQMAEYQPPDKQANRKRNKTGYNMFFSAHVLRLKQSELGVPSERGSVARLVGNAWKQLSTEEKQYYEREADKHNGMNPVEKEGEEEDDDENKRGGADPYGHMPHPHEMHIHGGMVAPPVHAGMHQAAQHDPRHHGYYPAHMYGQPPHGYYDYSHHPQGRQGGRQGYQYPPQQGHPYEQQQAYQR